MCRERSCHGQCSGGAGCPREELAKANEAQKEFQQKIIFQTRAQGGEYCCDFYFICTVNVCDCWYSRPSCQPHNNIYCYHHYCWHCLTSRRITSERGVVSRLFVDDLYYWYSTRGFYHNVQRFISTDITTISCSPSRCFVDRSSPCSTGKRWWVIE